MVSLRTFGSIDLTADDRPGAAALLSQPKRFALLVYLAVAAPRGFVRRDTLLALFWPETDQARGRNVLRQTVYLLRQSLGGNAITSRGDEELGVDPAVVQCDVTQFEAELEAGRTGEALELYRGDFLVGFHVPDAAPELDEWMQSQARRLRALATHAAWTQATAQEQAGNTRAAHQLGRRALAMDPLNEKLVTDVMQLLARTGDRAGALHAYDEYARRTEEDLGIEPEGAVQRVAAALRTTERSPAPEVTPPSPTLPVATVPATVPQRAGPVHRQPWPARALLWSLPFAVAIGLAAFLLRDNANGPTHAVIAVERITNAPGDSLHPPSNVPADLLSTSLARLAGVQVIPVTRLYDVQSQLRAAGRSVTSTLAAAKQAGAELLIQGVLHETASGVQLDLQVIDARIGTVVRSYRAHGPDLFAAVDDATAQIALAYGVEMPRQNIAEVTTRSLVAYRFYDQGLQAYYQEDGAAAHRLFRAALDEDTSFVMAAYYAGLTAYPDSASTALLLRAARLADRVPERERLVIQSLVTAAGYSSSTTSPADSLSARYPLDPDAQYAMGQVWERRGDFMTAARLFRRVIAMDSLSLLRQARCLACDAYEKLWWAYVYADSAAAAERVAREFAAVRPGSPRARHMIAMALARHDRADESWNEMRALDSLRAGGVNLDLHGAMAAIRRGDFATADARLQRLRGESNTPQSRGQADWYLALSLRNQGRQREALRVANQLSEQLVSAIVLLEMGQSRQAAKIFESLQAPTDVGMPGVTARNHAWMLTHVATSLNAAGDSARLRALADSVERIGQLSAFGRDLRLHHYIRGLLWSARGQPARAAESFRQSVWSWSEGYTRANYELSRTLLAMKQSAQAIYPLQAALRGDLESSNLYVTRTELHELLAQSFDQLGQRDSAVVHYRQVVTAWRAADPLFAARRDAAQRRLGALTQLTKL